ncbi:MAG: hypothetical protein GY707_02735 [Desulfobacteraceae bacterium]|nr:hypothetical protein [Desulfobacteraceae bacterium]
MKISNPETIEESEKEFIDLINAELDWEAIEELLIEKHNFTLQEEVEYKNGDIVVHNDSIAYKFDFNIKVPLSIIFNRAGEFLELSTSEPDKLEEPEENEEDGINADIDDESTNKGDNKQKLATDIAGMISEINQED